MQTVGSVASVVAAIREDAAAEVERLDEAIAAEVESIRAEEKNANVAISDREARLAMARRENQERIAQQEWEGRRAVIEQREAWISRVIDNARVERPTQEQLTALIREGIRNVGATECEVAVAASDRDRVDPSRFEQTIHITTSAIDGGCIVTAAETVFDNSLEARAKRLENEWRKALGEVYRL